MILVFIHKPAPHLSVAVNMLMDIVILNSGPKESTGYRKPVYYRTLGAYKIAHSCRTHGYSVQVIDHVIHFSESELVELMLHYIDANTSILAISTTFLAVMGKLPQEVINAIATVTNEFPKLKIVMGGYSTVAAKGISEFTTYAIITQYGEDIFKDVANFLIRNDKEPQFTIEIIPNSNKTLKVYSTPLENTYNIETDNFRFHKDDVILQHETLPLEVSRGCIFKCKFCNHLLLGRGKLDYLRSFDLIKEELLFNYNNWGTTSYYIICDTFNDTLHKMTEWHKMIMSLPFKIKFTAYLRADLLDKFEDVPYMLQESGLVTCFHGIESLNRESALAVGKGWSGTRAKEYIPKLYHDIWKKQVLQSVSFIVGLPGDTRENNYDTVDWAIQNDLYHTIFHPLGLTNNKEIKNLSEFERDSEKYGYKFNTQPAGLTSYGNWHNDYWSLTEVIDFIATDIEPRLGSHNAKIGSWHIMQYIGLGFNSSNFLRKKIFISDEIVYAQIHTYKHKLLTK